jgi:hypothetical protein
MNQYRRAVLHISICCKAVQLQRIGSPNSHNWNVLQLCCSLPKSNTVQKNCTAYQHMLLQRIGSPNEHNWNVLQLCALYLKVMPKSCTAYQHILQSSTVAVRLQPSISIIETCCSCAFSMYFPIQKSCSIFAAVLQVCWKYAAILDRNYASGALRLCCNSVRVQ